MEKIKLAQYWAAACGGCDVAVLDLNERILEVDEHAELVFWPIALDFKYQDLRAASAGSVDICFFSGAIRNAENESIARILRRNSKILVAFGSCAHLGGIPGLANLFSRRSILRHVYHDTASTVNAGSTVPLESVSTPFGELELPAFHHQVRALDEVVPVDYYLPGCPPVPERIWEVVTAALSGSLPAVGAVVGASDTALCEECPRKKDEKRIKEFRSVASFTPDTETCLLEQGIVCCGPGTRGGCGALCVKANMPCRGCYGPPPGVVDQGAKILSAVASAIDSDDPEEVERIVEGVLDPAGTFYRFSLPHGSLAKAQRKEVA